MTPLEVFAGFWWLIFPIMGFAFGGFGMFMRHRQSQKALDILKAYADQGKDPPPEVLRAVYGHADPTAPIPPIAPGEPAGPLNGGPGYGYGPGPGYGPGWGGGWGGPWGSRRAYRYYRWGPFWAWRRAIIFICLASGFGAAAWYEGGDARDGFVIVTIIMSVLAVGSLLTAILQSVWKPK
jgi:hypothetical protein